MKKENIFYTKKMPFTAFGKMTGIWRGGLPVITFTYYGIKGFFGLAVKKDYIRKNK